MIAFKTYADVGETPPDGLSEYYPAIEQEVTAEEAVTMIDAGYVVKTNEDYLLYRKSIDPQFYVQEAIQDAINFGLICIKEFSAQNVLLGITQSGMTGVVLTHLHNVMQALMAGSLYEALSRVRAINPADYDGVFLSETRILVFINKIEKYLGLPISTSIN
jgi:hypothetical protein